MPSGVETRVTATQRALNTFAGRGVAGCVDKAGRNWNLGNRAQMATRTAVIRSAQKGRAVKYEAAGEDLVVVSDHWQECELCEPWEGRGLSLTGNTTGYPTLDEAQAEGLFNPNCRHTTNLWVLGLSKIPERQGPKDEREAR